MENKKTEQQDPIIVIKPIVKEDGEEGVSIAVNGEREACLSALSHALVDVIMLTTSSDDASNAGVSSPIEILTARRDLLNLFMEATGKRLAARSVSDLVKDFDRACSDTKDSVNDAFAAAQPRGRDA